MPDYKHDYRWLNGNVGMPMFPGFEITSEAGNSKMVHDTYEVYLNNDYVGKKTLLDQGERLSDIDSYLKTQGVNDFTSKQDGDYYLISSGNEEGRIRDVLNIYLNIR